MEIMRALGWAIVEEQELQHAIADAPQTNIDDVVIDAGVYNTFANIFL